MHIAKEEKPIWKSDILYGFNDNTFWKKWNYINCKKIYGCQGLGGGKDTGGWNWWI